MHASSSRADTSDFGKLIPYSVEIADPGVPPPNGQEVLRFLDSALVSLSATDLGFTEFCRLCPTADSDRISKLREKKLNAKTISSASESASDDTSGTTVKAEGNEVKSDLSPPTKPTSGSLGAAAAYAPADRSAHVNSVFSPSGGFGRIHASAVPTYLDPLTERAESVEWARLRIICQRLCEAVMVNHQHLIASCVQGDIAGLLGKIATLCLGDENVLLMDHFAAMVDMGRSPPKRWPDLSALLGKLQLNFDRIPVGHPMRIGPGVLVQHAYRALAHYPELSVELALLRKVSGVTVTVDRIIGDISSAVNLRGDSASKSAADPPSRISGHVAKPVVAGDKAAGVCYHFRDYGRCKYGDQCKYPHVPRQDAGGDAKQTSGVCYECGSSSHGVQDCPVATKRKGSAPKISAKQAKLAALTKDNTDLKAQFLADKTALEAKLAAATAAIPVPVPVPGYPNTGITGKAANLDTDPLAVWGVDHEMAKLFSPSPSSP